MEGADKDGDWAFTLNTLPQSFLKVGLGTYTEHCWIESEKKNPQIAV